MITRELENLIVRRGLVAQHNVHLAQNATRGTGWSWLERLIVLGLVDEDAICRCVSEAFHLARCPRVALAHVPAAAIALLPPEVAAEHRAVPIDIEYDGDLRLAMADPTDANVVREIEFFTGRRVVRTVARATDVAEALRQYYGVVTVLWPRVRAQDLAGLQALRSPPTTPLGAILV
jgi:hypothetical protein